ncbi:MAG: ABC transporter ATP-binding protein [Actinomycetota bacterium]
MLTTFRIMMEASGSKAFLMRRAIAFSFVSATLQGLAYATLFPLLSSLIDGSDDVWLYVATAAALIVLDAMVRYASVPTGWRIALEVADETRVELGEQLRRIPLQELARRRTGELNNVITDNVNVVVAISSGLFGIVIMTIVTPVVTVVATLFVDWRLAVAMAVLFPMAAPLYRVIRANGHHQTRASLSAHADVASQVVEYAQGLSVLRSAGQVGPQSRRLQDSLERLRAVQSAGQRSATRPVLAVAAIVQIGILAVTALGVLLVVDGSLDVAAVAAVAVVAVRFSEPLSLYATFSIMFDAVEAAVERIGELFAIEELPTLDAGTPPTSARVVFDDVSFAYADGGDDAVRELSFTADERDLTAFVGTSGSGKTTIARLLTRFADPRHGTITIGGVDVRSLSQSELMRQFSVVFQDVHLFDDSIRANIAIARPGAADDEIVAAATAANCHEFISALPDGYETGVGEIGGALSGGERQRISIARAILKDAPIVILDEPTSALDTESELAVQSAIDTLVHDKTVIVIAHRLTTIAGADQIIVLEAGEIVERGTHTELIDSDGRYAHMWRAQRAERHWQLIT